MTTSIRTIAAILLFAGAAQFAHAQVITDSYIERGLTYPGARSFEGDQYTSRYSYGTGAFIFINGDSRQIRYLDYLDRADRAVKFGYRMPVDPYFPEAMIVDGVVVEEPVVVSPPPPQRIFFGGGFGIFRRR